MKNKYKDNILEEIVQRFLNNETKGYLPFIFINTPNIISFKVINLNGNWNIALIDKELKKVTYLYNCSCNFNDFNNIENSNNYLSLKIKYDYIIK